MKEFHGRGAHSPRRHSAADKGKFSFAATSGRANGPQSVGAYRYTPFVQGSVLQLATNLPGTLGAYRCAPTRPASAANLCQGRAKRGSWIEVPQMPSPLLQQGAPRGSL